MKKFKELYSYRNMILGLVRRDLRGRYKGSFLGFLWNFVNPLCQIIVYSLVFSQVFKTNIEVYYVYLMVGIMPWNFFAESLNQGSGCILAEGDMVKKIYFPREVLVVSAVTSRLINFLISYVIVFGVMIFSKMTIDFSKLLYLVPLIALQYFFTLGFSLLLSAINVYFRDVQYMTGVFLMALMWLSPVMYTIEILDPAIAKVVKLMPMTFFIDMYHDIMYFQSVDSSDFGFLFLMSLIVLIVGEIVFSKLDAGFAEEL